MPRSLPVTLALLLAGTLLAACATIPVTTDYDETTEFLFYTSFAVVPPPPGDSPRPVESLTDARLRRAIAEGLEAKGLASVPRDKADLLVRWRTRFRYRMVVVEPWGRPFWGPRHHEVYRFREGVFTIEMIDRKKRQVVWTGSAAAVDDPERNRETVRRAVRAILAKFPPMHG